ncbi:hypothetical protein KI429_05905 [Pseudomonas shirazica]|nr:hypothetical protein KI429_05905 [Pseudomonas shirazica]
MALDFSRLADGATLPAEAVGCDFVIAPVERINGDLVLTLMLPHDADAPQGRASRSTSIRVTVRCSCPAWSWANVYPPLPV